MSGLRPDYGIVGPVKRAWSSKSDNIPLRDLAIVTLNLSMKCGACGRSKIGQAFKSGQFSYYISGLAAGSMATWS